MYHDCTQRPRRAVAIVPQSLGLPGRDLYHAVSSNQAARAVAVLVGAFGYWRIKE